MQLAHQMILSPSKPYGPLCTFTFILEKLKKSFDDHAKKRNASPSRIVCTLMSQIIPLPTLTLLRTWYKESTHPSIVLATLSAPPSASGPKL